MKKALIILAAATIPMWATGSSVMAAWDGQLGIENDWDDNGDHEGTAKTRIRYKGKGWKAQVEYKSGWEGAVEDGTVELQGDYSWKVGEKGKFTLMNELPYNMGKESWGGELTPRYYYKLANGFRVGFDLEIDYLKADDWDIHEIEIEPTILWGKQMGIGILDLELEAPVMRLYSNKDGVDDFEVETIEPIAAYTIPWGGQKGTNIVFEVGAPYQVEDEEWEQYFNVFINHKF
ncbi:MAG: hypothetical protein ABFR63_10630 [Thermodesulfobacteriota bacterium]